MCCWFAVKDGFLGPDGNPAPDLPTMRMRLTFEPHGGGRHGGGDDVLLPRGAQELLDMGMEEGTKGRHGADRQCACGLTAPGPCASC